MLSKRGRSGASVSVEGDLVVKTGTDPKVVERLLEQARFMRAHPAHFPRILETRPDGYVMERLDEPNRTSPDRLAAQVAVLEMMCFLLWQETVPPPDFGWTQRLVNYLSQRVPDAEAKPVIERIGGIARRLPHWRNGHTIHGDPTLDNMLATPYSHNFGYCFIDPLPVSDPRGPIPRHKTVDLGKILQSLTGWERRMYGWIEMPDENLSWFCSGLERDDCIAAWMFCGVHYLRAVPYVGVEHRGWCIRQADMASQYAELFERRNS